MTNMESSDGNSFCPKGNVTRRTLTILGSTGSIGVSALDVIARHPESYKVFALTGNSRIERLAEQCRQFHPAYAVVTGSESATRLQALLEGCDTEVLWGENALSRVASADDIDTVIAAIVGSAGLLPALSAASSGKRILLANKESLVMAGGLFMEAVRSGQAELLPVDSEHNAIFQCLPPASQLPAAGVRKILLTGSGGPFRTTPLDELSAKTPDQACAHPNWDMGRKISVDSATMMNKGLELIEACWLFDVAPADIEVVIHPQSVIHSMVEYLDGSVLAQLGNPDMRTPIAHALAWPQRIESGVSPLDVVATARLDFEAPDENRFSCLRLARQAAEAGGDVSTALNAANEVAVEAFLERRIAFTDICAVVDSVLQSWDRGEPEVLDEVQRADKVARQRALQVIKR